MRAYVRTSRRTGVSMPLWLAPLAYLLWLTLAVIYWFGLAVVWATVLTIRLLGLGWERWRTRHPRYG